MSYTVFLNFLLIVKLGCLYYVIPSVLPRFRKCILEKTLPKTLLRVLKTLNEIGNFFGPENSITRKF